MVCFVVVLGGNGCGGDGICWFGSVGRLDGVG